MANKNVKVILSVLLVVSIIAAVYIRNTYHRSAKVFSTNSERNEDNGFKTAQFEKLNGNDYYELNSTDIEQMSYKYSYEITSGHIEFIFLVNNKRVWSSGKLAGRGTGSGYSRQNSGEKIKLRIIGKNADGEYKFEWDSK